MRSTPVAACRWTVPGVLVITAIVAVPDSSAANSTQTAAPTSMMLTDTVARTHATRGIVQTIDAHTMVIARRGNRGRMTFSLTPSTRREDAIVVGSTVSVRFREEGQRHIATAVALQRPADLH